MKVLICGDRGWIDFMLIEQFIYWLSLLGYDTLIEGECRGADLIAKEQAEKHGMIIEPYPAQWEVYHKAAGPIRNTKMLIEGKPDLVIAFHSNIKESRGTRDMISKSLKAGVRTILVGDKGEGNAKVLREIEEILSRSR